MTRSLTALALTFLAGTGIAAAQPRGTYHAVGTEPFWNVTITPEQLLFEQSDGESFHIARPRPSYPASNGVIYRAGRITVEVRRNISCNDGMSDRTYADTVTVRLGRRILHGCGGAYREAEANLTNSSWRITAIDSRLVPADGPYHIEFTADRISGQAGCNSFGGSYRIEGNRLTAGPLISTRMACLGDGRMENERAAMAILRGPVTLHRLTEQSLELRGTTGSISLRMVPGARPRG